MRVPKKDAEGNIIPGLFEDLPELGITKIVKKMQPPNATSLVWITKNLIPEVYRDRKEVELSGDVGNKKGVDVSAVKTEDLQDFVKTYAASLKAGDSDGGPEQGES